MVPGTGGQAAGIKPAPRGGKKALKIYRL